MDYALAPPVKALELIEECVLVLSPAGRLVFINNQALLLYSWCRQNVLENFFLELLTKSNLPSPLPEDFTFPYDGRELGEVENFFNSVPHRILSWRLIPFSIERNELGLLLIGKDITQLRQAEEKIFELDSIIAQTPGNLYWFSKDNIYLGCNEHSARLLGMTREEAAGQDFRCLMSMLGTPDPDLVDTLIAQGQAVIESGKPLLNVEEPPFAGKDKKLRYYLASKVPLRNRHGEIYGVIGISLDITQRKQLENKLREALAREERFKAMSALGAMIAHELRTPLASLHALAFSMKKSMPKLIQGYEISVHENKVDQPIRKDILAALKQSIEEIDQGVSYCQSTISSVLKGFGYISSATETNNEPLYLPDLIKINLSSYPFRLDQRDLIKIKHLDEVTVLGDKNILNLVLNNLLKNALQSISVKGAGDIFIYSTIKNSEVILTVEDTGLGASPDKIKLIFEPFYTTKNKASGSVGLGLYFCKMALSKMNASIYCESELGRYMKFHITLSILSLPD